jgi:hypothetical protein
MKNKFLKITLIIVGLAIVIIGGLFLVQKLSKKPLPNTTTQPAQLSQFNQLPFQNDDFRIAYDPNQNTLTISPEIPFDISQTPQYFLKTYWDEYQSYGKEALTWLSTNQMGQDFRTNYGVQIIWWGQEWWPAGATTPSL